MTNNPVPQWTQIIGRRAKHARSNHHRYQLDSGALHTTYRYREHVKARERRTTVGYPTAIGCDCSKGDTRREANPKEHGRRTPTAHVAEIHPDVGNCSYTACNSWGKGGRGGDVGGYSWDRGGWSWGVDGNWEVVTGVREGGVGGLAEDWEVVAGVRKGGVGGLAGV
jgi:hypothetical protein